MSRIVVAMSGGVDSSVTAALLHEQGHDVIGVHMRLHDAHGGGPGHCCGVDDALDARRVADQLGVPFYVMDLREAFKKSVMDAFADAYVRGRTPNPCVQCNGVLKFRVLMARALALGADSLATGHYCRIEDGALRMARDEAKDQSYFLFQLTPKALARTRFPLGPLTKDEVRDHAARLQLHLADKPESQDVCFLPDANHTGFVAEQRPEVDAAGEIIDEAGNVLGYHDAYYRYTVGQRRGIGIALGYPAYVIRVEPDTKRVVVAPADRLEHEGLVADDATWLAKPTHDTPLTARIRHRGPRIPCSVRFQDDDVHVAFHTRARAVSPGQAVVFYEGDRVLGGAWIRHALQTQAVA